MEHLGQDISVKTLEGNAVLPNSQMFKARYTCVFQESGERFVSECFFCGTGVFLTHVFLSIGTCPSIIANRFHAQILTNANSST
jgi:hypothetical protein